MSQKKSKSRKTTRTRKTVKTAKAARKPRTMTLAVVEPRLRASSKPRDRVTVKASPDRRANEAVEVSGRGSPPEPSRFANDTQAQPYDLLIWSPWSVMLRQQALVARTLSNMMRAQQQLARMLSS
jgi:hypothetical protein